MPTAAASRLAVATGMVILGLWFAGTWLLATSEPRLVFDRNLATPLGGVVTSIEEAGDGFGFELRASIVYLCVALVGVVIAVRQPRNPIGWLLCLMGAPMVAKTKVWIIQLVVGCALLVAASLYTMTNLDLMPGVGTAARTTHHVAPHASSGEGSGPASARIRCPRRPVLRRQPAGWLRPTRHSLLRWRFRQRDWWASSGS